MQSYKFYYSRFLWRKVIQLKRNKTQHFSISDGHDDDDDRETSQTEGENTFAWPTHSTYDEQRYFHRPLLVTYLDTQITNVSLKDILTIWDHVFRTNIFQLYDESSTLFKSLQLRAKIVASRMEILNNIFVFIDYSVLLWWRICCPQWVVSWSE